MPGDDEYTWGERLHDWLFTDSMMPPLWTYVWYFMTLCMAYSPTPPHWVLIGIVYTFGTIAAVAWLADLATKREAYRQAVIDRLRGESVPNPYVHGEYPRTPTYPFHVSRSGATNG